MGIGPATRAAQRLVNTWFSHLSVTLGRSSTTLVGSCVSSPCDPLEQLHYCFYRVRPNPGGLHSRRGLQQELRHKTHNFSLDQPQAMCIVY